MDEREAEDLYNPDTVENRKFREALIESLWLYAGETGLTASKETPMSGRSSKQATGSVCSVDPKGAPAALK